MANFPPSRPQQQPGRVIAFAGPREGVGKSTTCLNLALAYAGSTNRKTIIVSLERSGRPEISKRLGVVAPTVVALSAAPRAPRSESVRAILGAVPISQWGVGSLYLADSMEALRALSPFTVVRILDILATRYDLFFDVESYSSFQYFALRLANIVFWNCLPCKADFEVTGKFFEKARRLQFPLERFEVVINEANASGGMSIEEAAKKTSALLGRSTLAFLPEEKMIPRCDRDNQILIVESIESPWIRELRKLLERVFELKPTPKNWEGYVLRDNPRNAQKPGGNW